MLCRRLSTIKLAIICLTLILFYGTYLFMQCSENGTETREKTIKNYQNPKIILKETETPLHIQKETIKSDESNQDWGSHTLAIIVPFRDRFEELLEFAPWIHKFLNNQKVKHKIIVVNQVDTHRFNRASLINIGFLMAEKEVDYVAMHDVDLLPNNPELKYSYPDKGPTHLASPELHPLYHYPKYVGGILMLTTEHFKLCRGLSNKFWGWGREDDEFYVRMKENDLTLFRPSGITTGYETFKHIHDKVKRPRDYKRYGTQKKAQFQRDRETGYDTVKYEVQLKTEMRIGDAPVDIYNVELYCDTSITPWCDHEQ